MRRGLEIVVTAILCILPLGAAESFLSNDEYAKMLYQNPRGISCAKCHGPKGEGGVISRYLEDGELRQITAPPIVNLPMKRFKEALKRRFRLMPEYFLTEEEMAYLYFYLSKQKPDNSNNANKNRKR